MPETLGDAVRPSNASNIPKMDNTIELSALVVCADENLSCDLQGESVVLNLQSGTYFGLNPLAARIWNLIQKPARVSSVLEELLQEYKVDAVQCEADLLSFLRLLQTHDLITVQGTADN